MGVSIAWNEIANTFSASIVDSTVEASGDTEVKATSDNVPIINVSVGLGMADQFTGGASVALNHIHNTTSAEVKATSGDLLIDTRALRVVARDRSELNAGAGNVAFGWGKDGPGSGGVTVAFSGINNTTQARIDDYNVQASGDVDVTAANDSVIRTFAVAAAVSTGGAMLAGSGAFSEIGNVTEAAVVSTGSRSIHAGGMTVTGRDDSMIIAVSGAAGGHRRQSSGGRRGCGQLGGQRNPGFGGKRRCGGDGRRCHRRREHDDHRHGLGFGRRRRFAGHRRLGDRIGHP